MESQLATVIGSFGAEALKSWGSYAIVLMVLGAIIWQQNKRLKAQDADIAELRADNAGLQESRLQDAKALIDVTKSGTATIAARSSGDEQFLKVLTTLVDEVAALKTAETSRRPRTR